MPNDGKTLKRIQDLSEDLRLAIAECDVDATGRMRRVVFKDRTDAAEAVALELSD